MFCLLQSNLFLISLFLSHSTSFFSVFSWNIKLPFLFVCLFLFCFLQWTVNEASTCNIITFVVWGSWPSHDCTIAKSSFGEHRRWQCIHCLLQSRFCFLYKLYNLTFGFLLPPLSSFVNDNNNARTRLNCRYTIMKKNPKKQRRYRQIDGETHTHIYTCANKHPRSHARTHAPTHSPSHTRTISYPSPNTHTRTHTRTHARADWTMGNTWGKYLRLKTQWMQSCPWPMDERLEMVSLWTHGQEQVSLSSSAGRSA